MNEKINQIENKINSVCELSKRAPKSRLIFSLIVIIIALLYIIAPSYLTAPYLKRLDATVLGLLILATLPWLALFVTEVEAFGIKAKLREALQVAEVAREKALEAKDVVSDTIEQAEMMRAETTVQATIKGRSSLEDLSKEYIETRSRMDPGSARTSQMTLLFSEMQKAATEAGSGSIQVRDWLNGDDAGKQLAAIAYSRAFIDEIQPKDLIDVIIKERQQPFIQYWALRVLNNIVDISNIRRFTSNDLQQVKGFVNMFKRGTDRYELSERIIRKLDRYLSSVS